MLKILLTDKNYRIEFVMYLVLMAISLLLLFYIWTQPWAHRKTPDGLGLAPFPIFFLLGMLLFGMLCLQDAYKNAVRGNEPEASPVTDMDWKSSIAVCAMAVVYSPLIWIMDPLVYAGLFTLLILLIGHVRQIRPLVLAVLGMMACIYILIIKVAEVFFPVIWLPYY